MTSTRCRLQVLGGLSIERLEPEQAPLLLSKGSLALLALLAASGTRDLPHACGPGAPQGDRALPDVA